MSDTIALSCAKCGSTEFRYPDGIQANLQDDDTITCNGCGAEGKYGAIMESAKKQAMDQIKASLGKLFK